MCVLKRGGGGGGNRNTRFFHKMENFHRKRNEITRMRFNRVWVKEGANLQQKIFSAFQILLTDPSDWRANLEGLSFYSLNDQEAVVLEEPFLEEEIVGALKDLNGEKALGLDGFTGAFWQFSWDFVKGEVL